MQKLLARTKYTTEYTARRVSKRKATEDKLKSIRDRLNNVVVRDETRRQNKANKQARWNSIHRGHLAPRQDVGKDAEQYGSIIQQRLQPLYVTEKMRSSCPFVVGDRVVLVGAQYRDRGRIGKVERVNEEGQVVFVEGVEMAAVFQPKFMRSMTKSNNPTHITHLPIPYKDVRLVYPLENPATGVLRDVVINDIDLRSPNRAERRSGIERPIRYISGVEPPVELPYPEEKEQEFTDTKSDTLRIEVEERTWVPTLGIPPMPENVLDELRHRYSRYRTRFDDAFIAKKEAAHKRVEDKKNALKIAARTPLDDVNYNKREEMRKAAAVAAEGGAWAPLSPEIIEGMANLALQAQERKGRILPAQTREQFERIREGFEDDEIALQAVPEIDAELVEEKMEGREDILDERSEVDRENEPISSNKS